MRNGDWSAELVLLHAAGAPPDAGLSERELLAAESHYGFRFPPDLRDLLATALPRGRCPNWRALGSAELDGMVGWPLDGLLFDVKHGSFWWPAWGPRPVDLAAALATARQEYAAVPFLVPVYGHRYLPAEPVLAGNPVLSVYQMDIIYYGGNLREYLDNEFGTPRDALSGPIRHIRFWSDVIDADDVPAA